MISDKVNNKDKETMIDIQKNLQTIKNRIEKTAIKFKRDPSEIKLIVVTKKFNFEKIKPLIDTGHLFFGENKVQEAEKKWKEIKKSKKNLKLHMIGRLQSNKAKKAVELFDYIHSLDSEKLANELCKRQKEKGKNLNYFIQVNLGSEEQKGGVAIKD